MSSQFDDDNDPYHEKRLEEAYAKDEENLRIEGDKRTLKVVKEAIEKQRKRAKEGLEMCETGVISKTDIDYYRGVLSASLHILQELKL